MTRDEANKLYRQHIENLPQKYFEHIIALIKKNYKDGYLFEFVLSDIVFEVSKKLESLDYKVEVEDGQPRQYHSSIYVTWH